MRKACTIKLIAVTVATAVLLDALHMHVAATPQYYGVVIKDGNPGDQSCTAYCQSPQGGPSYLTCIAAWDNSSSIASYIDCGAVRGTGPGSAPVTCQCGGPPGSVKHGNPGDLTCTSFCQANSPGPSYPKCVAALDTAAEGGGTYISCDTVRGNNVSHPVTCLCDTDTGASTFMKQGTGLVSCSDWCRSPQGGGYPTAMAAYDTWSQQYMDTNKPMSSGGGMPLQCSCLAQPTGVKKSGNLGSMSCDDYCAANANGMQAYTACSAAYDTAALKYIACSKVRGASLLKKEVVCYCYNIVQAKGATCSVPASLNVSAADPQANAVGQASLKASLMMSSSPAATGSEDSTSFEPGYLQWVKQHAASSDVFAVVTSVETYTTSLSQGRRLLESIADNSTDLNRTSHQTTRVNLLRQSDSAWKEITTGAGGFAFISNVTGCQPYEALASVQVIKAGVQMSTAYSCAAVGDGFVKRQPLISYATAYLYADKWWSLSKINVSCMSGAALPRSQSIPQTGFIGGFWLQAGSLLGGYMEEDEVEAKTGINMHFPKSNPDATTGMFLRWIYACAWPADNSRYTVDSQQCVELSTTQIKRGDSIEVLASHPMSCPGDMLLSAFKVNNDDRAHTAWMSYTCCKATPLPRHIPRIHKLKNCDRLSYLSQLYNSPPAALLWSSPGLKPVADDIFYQTPTQDLNLYLPNSASAVWGEKYAKKVADAMIDVQALQPVADPELLNTLLPIVLPLDIYTADAAVCLLMYAPTDDLELKTQRTHYLLGSFWSVLQNETIISTIQSLRNFNASFDSRMSAFELQRGQVCSNLTQFNSSQPSMVDCMCSTSSSVPLIKCLADIMAPLTVRKCADYQLLNNTTSACPLYYADGDDGIVYGKPELTAIGRFQPWDPQALPEGLWSTNNTPHSRAGRKILQGDTDSPVDVGALAQEDAAAEDFHTAAILAGAAVGEAAGGFAISYSAYLVGVAFAIETSAIMFATLVFAVVAAIITIIVAISFVFMAVFHKLSSAGVAKVVVVATLSTSQIQAALLALPHSPVVLYQSQQALMLPGQSLIQTTPLPLAATNAPAIPWSPPTDFAQPLNQAVAGCSKCGSSGAVGHRKLVSQTVPTPATNRKLWSTRTPEDAGRRLARANVHLARQTKSGKPARIVEDAVGVQTA